MSDIVLGIDLGTTNSAVAVADGGHARVLCDADGTRLIPSVVSFHPDGRVLVGDVARERRLVDAQNTVYAIKRLIGRPYDSPEVRRAQERFAFGIVEGENKGVRVSARGQTYALAEISAYVLRECRRVAEQVLGEPCTKVVITVPAAFNELQRSATKAAGRVAGLEVVRILNEPTAAAVAYGYQTTGKERIAVYDLGGGTFDITILELDNDVYEVVATGGDTFLGGEDIDVAIAEEMSTAFLRKHNWDPRTDRQAFERLRAAAEWTKCQLSAEMDAKTRIAELHYGPNGVPLDLEFRLGRMKLEEMILPLLNRSLGVCSEALRAASLVPKDIDSVVLVGGSTRIPLVRQLVRDFFGKDPRTEVDPDLVVALGAAIQGYVLSGARPGQSLSNIPPPTPKIVEETRRRKEAARQERPDQPAFAPPEQAVAPPPRIPPPSQMPPPPDAIPDLPAPVRAARGAKSLGAMEIVKVAARADKYVPPRPGGLTEVAPKRIITVDSSPRSALGMPAGRRGAPPPAMRPPPPPPRPAAGPHESLAQAPPMRAHAGPAMDDPFELPSLPEVELPAMGGDAPLDTEDTQAFASVPAPPVAEAPLPSYPSAFPAPPSPSLAQPVIAMPERAAPVLMDVNPHSLGVLTVGGICERLIKRNSPVPVEQVRQFSTARDDQDSVQILICQGESRAFGDNQPLGAIELSGIRRARRGDVRITVTFMLDANGTLDVAASDDGGSAQRIQVSLLGGLDAATVAQMRARQEATFR